MDYYIDGRKLSTELNHPYLGVMLSKDLKWNSHMNNIVAKANRSLGFVKRNIYPCSETTKRSAYATIVRPTLEYRRFHGRGRHLVGKAKNSNGLERVIQCNGYTNLAPSWLCLHV